MAFLLDTNACVDALKGHQQVVARMEAVSPDECAVSAVTAFELLNGARRSAQPEKETKKVEKFLAVVTVMPFDAGAAARAAKIRFDLERAGQKIGPYDLLIAAQALEAGRTLVTNNTREFGWVEELRLEDWRD